MYLRSLPLIPVGASLLLWSVASGLAAEPLAYIRGSELAGGGGERFGALQFGQAGVNYVYAAPTGELSRMTASFRVDTVPGAGELELAVHGRDDDFGSGCPIRILVNGTAVHDGTCGFPSHDWGTRRFALAEGTVHEGVNHLVIENTAERGDAGQPPWFMVAWVALGRPGFAARVPLHHELVVEVPATAEAFPGAGVGGGSQAPGFGLRGTKGWLWTPEQYLAEIPVLVDFRMNFLMNCYGSMCDIEHEPWGSPRCNRWYEPLPEAKREAYENVVRACQAAGIEFCFSMNPNLSSDRALDYGSDPDFEAVWQHYSWMQGLGVQWFNLALDDITRGIDAAGQARVCNRLLARLRERDPDAELIFCPTHYAGNGTAPEARAYLEILARELHPEILLFWTGDNVVGGISLEGAATYAGIAGHRLFLWDNYPVNDGQPTLHLGPVLRRDPGLAEVVVGYMANPMHKETQINRIPLYTCAAYAWDPVGYDPYSAIGQAVLYVAQGDRDDARALAQLVEAYPGMLLSGGGTGANWVRSQASAISVMPHSRALRQGYALHLETLSSDLDRRFPDRFRPARDRLRQDAAWVRQSLGTE